MERIWAFIVALAFCGSLAITFLLIDSVPTAGDTPNLQSVTGRIVESGVTEEAAASDADAPIEYTLLLKYEYEVQGAVFQATDIAPDLRITSRWESKIAEISERYPTGSDVQVYYNPQSPEVSALTQEDAISDEYRIIHFFVMLSVFLVGILTLLVSHIYGYSVPQIQLPISIGGYQVTQIIPLSVALTLMIGATVASYWARILIPDYVVPSDKITLNLLIIIGFAAAYVVGYLQAWYRHKQP